MRLRSRQLCLPDCDSEGYPMIVQPLPSLPQSLPHPPQPGLDEESGEILQKEIIVLRRARNLEAESSLDYLDLDYLTVELLHEQLYFRSFRPCELRFNSDEIYDCSEAGSDIVAFSHDSNHNAVTENCRCGTRKTQRKFQVPAKYLTNSATEEKRPCKAKCINIWQEFIYGPPVMMLQTYSLTKEEIRSITDVSSCLSQFFHKNIVDALLYMFFFGVYFVSCFIFNNILELAFYITYGGHLCIHQLASASNINLTFSGSIFQGPAYVFIRTFCKHCIQKENAKVMRQLMKKMKHDILSAAAS